MQKYAALSFIRVIFIGLAVLTVLAGVGLGILFMISPFPTLTYINGSPEFVPGPPQTGLGVGLVVVGLLLSLILFAFASLIQLLLDMAADMRATADYFRRRPPQQRSRRPIQTTEDAGEWDLPLPRPNIKP
jgi:hypothetical protein